MDLASSRGTCSSTTSQARRCLVANSVAAGGFARRRRLARELGFYQWYSPMSLGLHAARAGLDIGASQRQTLAGSRAWDSRHFVSKRRCTDSFPTTCCHPGDRAGAERVLRQAGLSPRSFRRLTLALSGPDVIVKQLALPLMDDAEVAGCAAVQARKAPAVRSRDDACSIYQILGRYPTSASSTCCCRRAAGAARPHARAAQAAGHRADIVDAAPLAKELLAKTGRSATRARVMRRLRPRGLVAHAAQRGARHFAAPARRFGGISVTELSRRRDTCAPFEETEEWKWKARAPTRQHARSTPTPRGMQAVQSCMRTLGDELRRSFTFYRTMAPLPDSFSAVRQAPRACPGVAGWLAEALDVPVLVYWLPSTCSAPILRRFRPAAAVLPSPTVSRWGPRECRSTRSASAARRSSNRSTARCEAILSSSGALPFGALASCSGSTVSTCASALRKAHHASGAGSRGSANRPQATRTGVRAPTTMLRVSTHHCPRPARQ